MSLLSVIVPCYNEEESVALFYQELTKNDPFFKEKEIELELLYIDDGSKDGTVREVKKLIEQDSRVHIVSFSRNFGKEAAMLAGLEQSRGDYCVILDADLQHPPRLIPQMYDYVRSGEYDCAATRRISRKGESKVLSFFARSFYKVINSISQTHIVDGAQDFRFMTRQMVNAILDMPEKNRFSKGIFSWVGFDTKFIEVENTERAAGKTTWNFKKLFLYSLDGIFAFSTAPLWLSIIMGIIFCLIALILFIKMLVCGDAFSGFGGISVLLCLIGGIQLFCMGVTGQYISKMYTEIKGRPSYIIKETEESRRRK